MKKEEAIKILEDKLSEYRKLPYSELVEKIGEHETFEGKNENGEYYKNGEYYQIEIEFFFDGHEETDLRVAGAISYSGWTDFFPACRDFIISPDGTFVDE